MRTNWIFLFDSNASKTWSQLIPHCPNYPARAIVAAQGRWAARAGQCLATEWRRLRHTQVLRIGLLSHQLKEIISWWYELNPPEHFYNSEGVGGVTPLGWYRGEGRGQKLTKTFILKKSCKKQLLTSVAKQPINQGFSGQWGIGFSTISQYC